MRLCRSTSSTKSRVSATDVMTTIVIVMREKMLARLRRLMLGKDSLMLWRLWRFRVWR